MAQPTTDDYEVVIVRNKPKQVFNDGLTVFGHRHGGQGMLVTIIVAIIVTAMVLSFTLHQVGVWSTAAENGVSIACLSGICLTVLLYVRTLYIMVGLGLVLIPVIIAVVLV